MFYWYLEVVTCDKQATWMDHAIHIVFQEHGTIIACCCTHIICLLDLHIRVVIGRSHLAVCGRIWINVNGSQVVGFSRRHVTSNTGDIDELLTWSALHRIQRWYVAGTMATRLVVYSNQINTIWHTKNQAGRRIGSRAAMLETTLMSVDVMVGMCDCVQQYPNFTPPMTSPIDAP